MLCPVGMCVKGMFVTIGPAKNHPFENDIKCNWSNESTVKNRFEGELGDRKERQTGLKKMPKRITHVASIHHQYACRRRQEAELYFSGSIIKLVV